MPVIPIVGAVVAIGIAAEVGTTLAIVAAVGATVGAVGAITGVKELQIAGTVIGAIGGIGAIAQSTGLLGEVGSFLGFGGTEAGNVAPLASGISEVAQEVGTFADDVATATTTAPVEGLTVGNSLQELQNVSQPVESVGQGIAGAGGEVVDPITHFSGEVAPSVYEATGSGMPPGIGDALPAAEATPAVQTAEATPDGIYNQSPGSPAAPSAVDPKTVATEAQTFGQVKGASPIDGKVDITNVPGPQGGYNSGIDPATGQTVLTSKSNGTVLASPVTGTVDGGSTWTKILDTLGKPGIGTLASGLVQAGSAFVSGATNALTPAQVAAYNAQADANLAQANLARQQQQLLQTQLENASAVPTATRRPGGLINSIPTGGTPQAPAAPQVAGQPQPSNTAYGLINSAYTKPTQITGAPA